MIGLITFLPTYVQGVLGGTALMAGFTLSAMSVGWPLASVAAGRLLVPLGVRRLSRLGGVAVLLGAVLVALLAARGALGAGSGSFALGVGLGLLSTTFIVAIQTRVDWARRGVATASNLLMRILGNAVGAALFGGLLNLRLRGFLARHGVQGRLSLDSVQGLLGGGGGPAPALDSAARALLRRGLEAGLQWVFWGIVLFSLLTLLAAWWMPELHGERRRTV